MILAGDIGGTKVNLGLYLEAGEYLKPLRESRYECCDYSGFDQILNVFLEDIESSPEIVCFGVAGPVKDGTCRVTNLGWDINASLIKEALGVKQVLLINDLAAMACSVPFLGDDEIEVLQMGVCENGDIAVLAAGTGLGQAFLIPGGHGRYRILETEGGHCDFAPRNPVEIQLLHFLLREFERVSIERVLSGAGVYRIYQFVCENLNFKEPDWLIQDFCENRPEEVVVKNGLNGKSNACKKTIEMFVEIYGATAGNMALQLKTTGGVYIGGGIAPNIVSLLKEGAFIESFLAKGRFREWLKQVPVRLILNGRASLLGAAHYALGQRFARL